MALAPSRNARRGCGTRPEAINIRHPAPMAMRAASSLVSIPPEPIADPGPPGHPQMRLGQGRNLGDVLRLGIQVGVRGVEAVHVRQQNQAVGADHLGDAGREPVVVPVTDFLGRHGVVLVDHRYRAAFQERDQRVDGVEIAAPVLAVIQCQEDLCRGDPVGAQDLLVRMGQPDLTGRGRGLTFLQPRGTRIDTQGPGAERNGARRYDHDLLAGGAHGRDLRTDCLQPIALQFAGRPVHEQCRTDLQDTAPDLRQPFGIECC